MKAPQSIPSNSYDLEKIDDNRHLIAGMWIQTANGDFVGMVTRVHASGFKVLPKKMAGVAGDHCLLEYSFNVKVAFYEQRQRPIPENLLREGMSVQTRDGENAGRVNFVNEGAYVINWTKLEGRRVPPQLTTYAFGQDFTLVRSELIG